MSKEGTAAMSAVYDEQQHDEFAQEVLRDGFCILPQHFPAWKMNRWREAFEPLLEAHIEHEGHLRNRGPARYYVTLPFIEPFSDPEIFENEDVLAICARLVGEDMVLCQIASDTPLLGSEYQEIHRDTPPLFPETGKETPAFQLAVNFPLVNVALDNGPFEIARSTNMISKEEALLSIESGNIALEPIAMRLGDVMIRDVRGLHRGTPNRTAQPRPMVVLGYSRRWLFRPEVSIRVPREALSTLSARARNLLRFNPIVDSLDVDQTEVYQSFAY